MPKTLPNVYTEVQFLGSGMAGAVYRIKSDGLSSSEDWVVKVVHKVKQQNRSEADVQAAAARTEIVKDFKSLELLRAKNNGKRRANLPRAYAIFESQPDPQRPERGSLFLVMSGVFGGSLKARIEHLGHYPESDGGAIQELRSILRGCMNAFRFMHDPLDSQGHGYGPNQISWRVVHRDVKPHNIVLSYAGNVTVVDYGAALHLENSTKRERQDAPGHDIYMAPEYVVNRMAKYTGHQKQEIDEKVDSYALGMVLMECVMGMERLPFGGHDGGVHKQDCDILRDKQSRVTMEWPAPLVEGHVQGQQQQQAANFQIPAVITKCADDVQIENMAAGFVRQYFQRNDEPPKYTQMGMNVTFRMSKDHNGFMGPIPVANVPSQMPPGEHQQHNVVPDNRCPCKRRLEDSIYEGITGAKLNDALVILSADLLDLIAGLLCHDREKRLSMREAYDHPWMQMRNPFEPTEDDCSKATFFSPKNFYKNYYKHGCAHQMCVFLFAGDILPETYAGRTLFCAVPMFDQPTLTHRIVATFILKVLFDYQYQPTEVYEVDSPSQKDDPLHQRKLNPQSDEEMITRCVYIVATEGRKGKK